MGRKLRYIPDPPTLVFITCRTVQGRFLFRPGVLGGLADYATRPAEFALDVESGRKAAARTG